jgi:hypothetical protein
MKKRTEFRTARSCLKLSSNAVNTGVSFPTVTGFLYVSRLVSSTVTCFFPYLDTAFKTEAAGRRGKKNII